MKDETDQGPAGATGAGPPRRKVTVLRLVFGALVVVTLVILTWIIIASVQPSPKFVWLNPETAFTSVPGPFSGLKDKLVNLPVIAPIWQRYQPKQPMILTSLRGYGFTSTNKSAALSRLGAPAGTNAAGLRAWILSPPTTLGGGDAPLGSMGEVNLSILGLVGSAPRTQTNGPFTFTATSSTLPGRNTPRTSGLAQTNSGPIQLTLRLTGKRPAGQTGDGGLRFTTNLDFACQAIVPDDGALVVDYGASLNPEQQHDWLIVFPRRIILRPPTNDVDFPVFPSRR